MICAGITGSYASGKTFVLDYLANLGYITFSSDEHIKDLYKEREIQNIVLELLGIKIFDKKQIAEIIYDDDSAREKLQNFIHPFVVKQLSLFKQRNNKLDITFVEVPLLFEAGFDQYLEFYITAFCSEKTRLERAKLREGFSLQTYNKIAIIQLSQKVKMDKANFAIDTDVDLINLDKQIVELIKKIRCLG